MAVPNSEPLHFPQYHDYWQIQELKSHFFHIIIVGRWNTRGNTEECWRINSCIISHTDSGWEKLLCQGILVLLLVSTLINSISYASKDVWLNFIFLFQIHIGAGEYIHARIYQPLSGPAVLTTVQSDKHHNDPLEYF